MSLKASDTGIQLIEKRINARGWYKQSPKWVAEALEIIKKENPEYEIDSNTRTGVAQATWNRFTRGKEAISNKAFKVFCKVLDLDWEEVAQLEQSEPIRNSFSYIPACGMNRPPEKRNLFNSYSGERAVHELWADPFAEKKAGIAAYIQAKIGSNEKREKFLRVNFVRQGWGVNVTIRPHNETPINASNFKYMRFRIKSPQEKRVGVRVRIVDADYVFWMYGEHKIYYYEGLSTSLDKWHDIAINLKSENWSHFDYDGLPIKRHKSKPNFKAIQLITFEVGTDEKPSIEEHMTRLGKNETEAVIDISPVIFE